MLNRHKQRLIGFTPGARRPIYHKLIVVYRIVDVTLLIAPLVIKLPCEFWWRADPRCHFYCWLEDSIAETLEDKSESSSGVKKTFGPPPQIFFWA